MHARSLPAIPKSSRHISIENFDEDDTHPPILTSPRSLEACNFVGVLPEDLVVKPLEAFEDVAVPKMVQHARWEHVNNRRKQLVQEVIAARNSLVSGRKLDWDSRTTPWRKRRSRQLSRGGGGGGEGGGTTGSGGDDSRGSTAPHPPPSSPQAPMYGSPMRPLGMSTGVDASPVSPLRSPSSATSGPSHPTPSLSSSGPTGAGVAAAAAAAAGAGGGTTAASSPTKAPGGPPPRQPQQVPLPPHSARAAGSSSLSTSQPLQPRPPNSPRTLPHPHFSVRPSTAPSVRPPSPEEVVAKVIEDEKRMQQTAATKALVEIERRQRLQAVLVDEELKQYHSRKILEAHKVKVQRRGMENRIRDQKHAGAALESQKIKQTEMEEAALSFRARQAERSAAFAASRKDGELRALEKMEREKEHMADVLRQKELNIIKFWEEKEEKERKRAAKIKEEEVRCAQLREEAEARRAKRIAEHVDASLAELEAVQARQNIIKEQRQREYEQRLAARLEAVKEAEELDRLEKERNEARLQYYKDRYPIVLQREKDKAAEKRAENAAFFERHHSASEKLLKEQAEERARRAAEHAAELKMRTDTVIGSARLTHQLRTDGFRQIFKEAEERVDVAIEERNQRGELIREENFRKFADTEINRKREERRREVHKLGLLRKSAEAARRAEAYQAQRAVVTQARLAVRHAGAENLERLQAVLEGEQRKLEQANQEVLRLAREEGQIPPNFSKKLPKSKKGHSFEEDPMVVREAGRLRGLTSGVTIALSDPMPHPPSRKATSLASIHSSGNNGSSSTGSNVVSRRRRKNNGGTTSIASLRHIRPGSAPAIHPDPIASVLKRIETSYNIKPTLAP